MQTLKSGEWSVELMYLAKEIQGDTGMDLMAAMDAARDELAGLLAVDLDTRYRPARVVMFSERELWSFTGGNNAND